MPISAAEPLLEIAGLHAGYGKIGVLRGIDLDVARRRGGGAARPQRRRQDHAAARGVGPAAVVGQRAFRRPRSRRRQPARQPCRPGSRMSSRDTACSPSLRCSTTCCSPPTTCRAASAPRASRRRSRFFPKSPPSATNARRALSGGQQQILAVAQGLVRRPRLLMLDEPSAGLSPVLVDRVLVVVRRLREAGTAVLLVEQLIEKALALADRVYALARGSIVLEAEPARPICRGGWSMPIWQPPGALLSPADFCSSFREIGRRKDPQ